MAEIRGLKFTVKGGPDSGHHDHAGNPPNIGGSLPGGAASPRMFRRPGGGPMSDEEIKEVEASHANSLQLKKDNPDRPIYFVTKKDLRKVSLHQYEKTREYLDANKKKFGKGYGLKCRDAAASAMKGHPEYLRGMGQGRFDKAVGLKYTEERPGSFFNLGYYRGFTDYLRDKRGGLKLQLPLGFEDVT